jgi:hypothetical protein
MRRAQAPKGNHLTRSALRPLLVVFSLLGCGQAAQAADKPLPRPVISQAEADTFVAQRFANELSELGKAGANIDAKGLLNENRQWGALYSPRFQMEAGTALRIGLAQNNRKMSAAGFRAILASMSAIAPDGAVVSRLPKELFPNIVPSTEDQASGAAFFLASACPAILAAKGHDVGFATAQEFEDVSQALARAIIWLETQDDVLVDADRRAPNRLLFDALAFQSCNEVAGRKTSKAEKFVRLALKQYRDDGVFVEGGGSDTTYQAVSVRLSLEILLAGYAQDNAENLWIAHLQGARWLAQRVGTDGSVDSSQNTRTCGGGEAFMGKKKRLSVKTVFQALAYAGIIAADSGLTDAAMRVSNWSRANPRTDPCL